MTDRSDRADGDGLLEAVTNELLAHGEFSSSQNKNRPNARLAAKEVIAIVLRASPPSGNAGERPKPVAWRWKPLGGAWQYAESDARFPDGAGTLQPLYAAPPQPAPDAVREALVESDEDVDVLPDGRCIPAISDQALWMLVNTLHSNVPESDRPMSWSDFSPEQVQRLRQSALAFIAALSAPVQSGGTEAPAQSSPCLRYVNGDAELVCKCVNGKYPEVVDIEWCPPTCKAVDARRQT